MTKTTIEAKEQNTRHALFVITIVALMSFFGVLTETSMNVTFPTLMHDFHVSLTTVQWVTSGYLLAAALVMLSSAYMKRRFTNRQLFITAALLFIIGDLMCALAPVFWVLLIGRLVQAGCVGLCGPLMVNIILDTVPTSKLGTYMGVANLIILIGPALGPTFGGAVANFFDWRMIFWSTLPFALLLLILGQGGIKQYTPTSAFAFDWLRFAALGVALISLTVGLNGVSDRTWALAGVAGLVVVVAMLVFLWLSKHHAKALFKLDVFHDAGFLYSFLPYILLQFSNVGINFLLPNYVQTVDGASAFVGGLILLPGSVFNGLGQPVYGWMLDHFGGRLPLLLGNSLFTLGMLGFTIWGRHISVLWVTVLYLIFAIGRSMAFGNSTAYGLKVMAHQYQSDANALYSTGQQVTGSIGTTVLAGMMTAVTVPGLTHAQNVGIGSQLAFGLLLLIGLINFGLYLQLFKATKSQD